jgi:lysine 2,3-aminomutase
MMADKTSNTLKSCHILATSISPHLRKLAAVSPQVKRQFFPTSEEVVSATHFFHDPLEEEQFVKTKGLIQKYPGRVLIETTLTCASYCRFCTRRRKVSDIAGGYLSTEHIDRIVAYVGKHQEISEVIFSGGDPFMAHRELEQLLTQIGTMPHIKVFRIHTRVPISNPKLFTASLENCLKRVNQPLYVSLHFEHPDEITHKTEEVILRLRKIGTILLSQTVFLKGVNDDYATLFTLFNRLVEIGVKPYYIHRCDPVIGAEQFQVPFERELEIMTQLRKNLSGIACPTYVIDAPKGVGKIPPPLLFWEFNKQHFYDFKDRKIAI